MGLAEVGPLSKFHEGGATGGGCGSVAARLLDSVGKDDCAGEVDPAATELVGDGADDACSTRLDLAAADGSGNRLGQLKLRVTSGALA